MVRPKNCLKIHLIIIIIIIIITSDVDSFGSPFGISEASRKNITLSDWSISIGMTSFKLHRV